MYKKIGTFGAASEARASSGDQAAQNAAREAAFAAEVARLAAMVDIVNGWASAAASSGKYPLVKGSDGLMEVPANVRDAFASFTGDSELSIKLSSSPGIDKPAPWIGITDPDGNYKFKLSEIRSAGKAFVLVSEKYLGSPQKIEFLISSGPAELARFAAPGAGYGILYAPDAYRKVPSESPASAKKAASISVKPSRDYYLGYRFSDPTVETLNRAGQVIVGTAAIYHGYKRNESIGWALVWGILGGTFWPIGAPLMLAQGFGQPKKK